MNNNMNKLVRIYNNKYKTEEGSHILSLIQIYVCIKIYLQIWIIKNVNLYQ